jgi:hypothetical protein
VERVAVTFSEDELVVLIAVLRNRYVKESVKRPLMDALVAALKEATQ